MQKRKEFVCFWRGGCVWARLGSIRGPSTPRIPPLDVWSIYPRAPPVALHVSSTFLLRNPYYFPYFRLARFDSRPDFDLISLRI